MPHQLDALALANTRLRPVDLAIVVLYLIAITLFGLRFREKKGQGKADRSLKSYFLANNTIPWWAIALSIVSAETSTLTIISIPGVAFGGDFGFLQVVLGYMLGRIVVAALFLPRYFAGEMLTAYQLIDQRFGAGLHKVTAGLFLLTRAAAEGVRVFAVSIVVAIAIGTGDRLSIGIICLLTLLYTFEGGMAAVVWTDVVQMAIYVAGTVVALFALGSHVPGGWSHIHMVASAAGKFHMLNFAMNLTQSYTFWAGVLGGTFLTMASHGTDQLMVQRMLAARNLNESRLALLSSGVVIFLQFAFFLLIGAGLFVFYGMHPTTFAGTDRIFPTFIVTEMPVGVAGLLIAAILAAAMSNLSAALNSLSSTTVVDFYMHLRSSADERERALISKSSTLFWALVLFGIAVATVAVGGKGHVVEIALSIASVAYGCLLGVFLLGTLTRFATEIGASIGMVVGFVLNVWLWQASFPKQFGPLVIPKIAFTWYVILGAIVTFAIGALASLVFRKQSRRTAVAASLLLLLVLAPGAFAQDRPRKATHHHNVPAQADFTSVVAQINEAITAHKLPGAVVVVGHNGNIVFHQAFGNRKLDGEPGLDGKPAPAELMTEDTVFDMASLTKCLSTATAIMQLYEQGKLHSFDDSVETYLPDFNAQHDPVRGKVTVRMLLTHFSGEAPDVSLKDPWGLAAPDRAEGQHRALTTALKDPPATKFVYSDINFILLGMIVEKLSGQREDDYVREHIYEPLGMIDSRYLATDRICGPHVLNGAAVQWSPSVLNTRILVKCPANTWSISLLPRIAPTTHDDESKSDPSANPHYDILTRGTVHDPTTRRMGGVAGHAGLFSTAHDVSLYAQAFLDKLLRNTGPFPLEQATLRMMIAPQQPGSNPQQLVAANLATQAAIAHRAEPGVDTTNDPLLAPAYPAVKGQNLRAFGWDVDTAFSKPRGMVFPVGSFGHTGFTGTTLWIDPSSDTYVVLLANAVHPRGGAPISPLRGEVATLVGQALHLPANGPGSPRQPKPSTPNERTPRSTSGEPAVLSGLDSLEAEHFSQLAPLAKQHDGKLRLGLLTNQAGIDFHRRTTIDILFRDLPKALPSARLTTLFAAEHGITAHADKENINGEVESSTGLPVVSLYGDKPESRRPTHEQLKDLDAVVIDLQDAGVHFWTYEAAMGYLLEASAREEREFRHRLDIVILDRPNLVASDKVQGPVSDSGISNYTDYMELPARHGMTYGELARFFNQFKLAADGKKLDAPLTIVRMQGYKRSMFFDETGLPWVNPSPNLKDSVAATLYPGIGLIETTNISVGRGTSEPFHLIGAGIPGTTKDNPTPKPWFKAADVASALTARKIPGVTFAAGTVVIDEDANKYPFHGQTIEVVRFTVTDRNALDTPALGIEILAVLHRLYPEAFKLDRAMRLVDNKATMEALARGDDARDVIAAWAPALRDFEAKRAQVLLY